MEYVNFLVYLVQVLYKFRRTTLQFIKCIDIFLNTAPKLPDRFKVGSDHFWYL